MTDRLAETAAGASVSVAEADALAKEHPYFIVPAVAALANADADERKRLKMRIACSVGSRDTLANLFGEEPEEFLSFYPDQRKPELSTEDTIDSFLDRFGDKMEAHAEGEIPIAPPAIDYAATMIADNPKMPETGTSDGTSAMLDSFLGNAPQPHKQAEPTALTESFARIMIKNRNYDKALEIIEALSLNNPEKSIYFADQIRFLRKLILNESKKQR